MSPARLRLLSLVMLIGLPAHIVGCGALPPYPVRYASAPPTIDGKLDDAAWKNAAPLTRFFRYRTHGVRLDGTAVAYLAWDKDNLYFAIDIRDEDLYCTEKENDKVLCRADVAELFLKPRDDRFNLYEFEFNLFNATWDIHFVSMGGGGTRRFGPSFTSGAKVRSSYQGTINNWTDRDSSWTLEAAIPMTAFKDVVPGGPRPGERWRFNVAGYDFSVYRERPLLFTLCDGNFKGFKEYALYPEMEFMGP